MENPRCPGWGPVLDGLADDELAREDARRVRAHVEQCPRCRAEVASVAELKRRFAAAPAPPSPPELPARVRTALDRADRERRSAWTRRAVPIAAALLVGLAVSLWRPPGAAAQIPPMVLRSAEFHDRILTGAEPTESADSADAIRDHFRRALGTEVALPDPTGMDLKGCCCPSLDRAAVPWIVYRRGNTTVSLVVVRDVDTPLPDAARKSRDGRAYYAFRCGANSVILCRTEKVCHLWIARLPEKELLDLILQTREGHSMFSGARLTLQGVT